jgi:hypothetical protein
MMVTHAPLILAPMESASTPWLVEMPLVLLARLVVFQTAQTFNAVRTAVEASVEHAHLDKVARTVDAALLPPLEAAATQLHY